MLIISSGLYGYYNYNFKKWDTFSKKKKKKKFSLALIFTSFFFKKKLQCKKIKLNYFL